MVRARGGLVPPCWAFVRGLRATCRAVGCGVAIAVWRGWAGWGARACSLALSVGRAEAAMAVLRLSWGEGVGMWGSGGESAELHGLGRDMCVGAHS